MALPTLRPAEPGEALPEEGRPAAQPAQRPEHVSRRVSSSSSRPRAAPSSASLATRRDLRRRTSCLSAGELGRTPAESTQRSSAIRGASRRKIQTAKAQEPRKIAAAGSRFSDAAGRLDGRRAPAVRQDPDPHLLEDHRQRVDHQQVFGGLAFEGGDRIEDRRPVEEHLRDDEPDDRDVAEAHVEDGQSAALTAAVKTKRKSEGDRQQQPGPGRVDAEGEDEDEDDRPC